MKEFVNWSGTVRGQPARWASPATVGEVQQLVREARARGQHVRAVGAGHSWSALVPTDGVLMSLQQLDQVHEVDHEALEVVVEAGISLQALCQVLDRQGLALPIMGSVAAQSLAGAIATGTHGSSLSHGNLGTGVRELWLVDGRGDLVHLTRDDPRLDGARVHLGALGVVVMVRLAVRRAFRLVEHRRRVPLEEVTPQLLAWAQRHTFVKVWWLPHTDFAWVVSMEETDAPDQLSPLAMSLDKLANDVVFGPVLELQRRVPALVPTVNRVVAQAHFSEGTRTGRSDRLFTLPMPPRHRETELAFPVEHAPAAFAWLRRWIDEAEARIGFIVEIRFVAGDGGWISPAYGHDVCQLGLYGAWGGDVDRYFAAAQEAGKDWDARPHWGKELRCVPEDLDRWYPKAAAFRELVAAFDPDGVFRNPLLDQVLGPLGSGAGIDA